MSSNGNIFRVNGPLCGKFTGPGEFPAQRRVTRSFDVFFDLRLNERLSKQPCGWWFETPSWSLWRQCNDKWGSESNLSKTTFWDLFHEFIFCCRCNKMYFAFATIIRGSIMSKTHKWTVIIYGSPRAELMETRYNDHIHMYGRLISGNIIAYVTKVIENNNQILWKL